jgi:hypothetical protein
MPQQSERIPSSAHINCDQEHELRGWAESLGTRPQRMREVVRRLGNAVMNVRGTSGRSAPGATSFRVDVIVTQVLFPVHR